MNKDDYAILSSAFGEFDKFWSKNRRVYVSKNMCVLLHNLLLSLDFVDGEMVFAPTNERAKVLSTFNEKDIIDCYERLPLLDITFGQGLSDISKDYVYKKLRNMRNYAKNLEKEI